MEHVALNPARPEVGVESSSKSPVLVATDGRFRSDAAVRMGRLLGRLPKALRVVTVVSRAGIGSALPAAISADLDAARRAETRARAVTQVQRTLSEWVDLELLEGEPIVSILEAARSSNASLIVCGLGQHRGWHNDPAGHVLLEIVRQAGVPVYAVAQDAAGAPSRIVAGIDFSEPSISAAAVAVEMAAPGASIYLVHVVSRDLPPEPGDRSVERRRAGGSRFDGVRARLRVPADMTVYNIFLRGSPAEELLLLADTVGADLLAVGTHGRGLLGRVLLGSVATQLLRRARCSVLTVSTAASTRLAAPVERRSYSSTMSVPIAPF